MLFKEIIGTFREKETVGNGGDFLSLSPGCLQSPQLSLQCHPLLLLVEGHLQRQPGGAGQALDEAHVLLLHRLP